MFVNNFLASIQVRLSPNVVSHTLGYRGRGDWILEGQRSTSVGEVCALLNALLVSTGFGKPSAEGSPFWCTTSQLGQLSLAILLWVGTWSTSERGVHRHALYQWSCSVSWCVDEGCINGGHHYYMDSRDFTISLPMPIAVTGVEFLSLFVYVSVSLHNISKADAPNLTWWVLETRLFGGQNVEVTSNRKIAGVGLCSLVIASF